MSNFISSLQRDPRGFQVDLVFCKEDSLSKKKSTCKSRVFARIKPRAGRIPLADSSLKEIEALTNPSKGTVNRPQVPLWSQLPSLRKAVESGWAVADFTHFPKEIEVEQNQNIKILSKPSLTRPDISLGLNPWYGKKMSHKYTRKFCYFKKNSMIEALEKQTFVKWIIVYWSVCSENVCF